MIFVALGTQKFPMNRVLIKLDQLKALGKLEEDIYAQIGHSDYTPKEYEYCRFLSQELFEENIQKCDLLITHGGVGTIVKGLSQEKKIIVVPRLEKYGEHVDDHQLQIADSFSDQGYVIECIDVNELDGAIRESEKFKFRQYESKRSEMISFLEHYLEQLGME